MFDERKQMIIILSTLRAVLVVAIISCAFLILDGVGMATSGLGRAGMSQAGGAACGLAAVLVAWRIATAKKQRLIAAGKKDRKTSNQASDATSEPAPSAASSSHQG